MKIIVRGHVNTLILISTALLIALIIGVCADSRIRVVNINTSQVTKVKHEHLIKVMNTEYISSDKLITEDTMYNNTNIIVESQYDGDICIEVNGAKLEIMNSIVNSSTGYRYYIIVRGGELVIKNSRVILSGFEFGNKGDHSGIFVDGGNLTIIDSVIESPYIGFFANNSYVKVINVTVVNPTSYAGVVYSSSSKSGLISSLHVSSSSNGLWLWYASNVTVENCDFDDVGVSISTSYTTDLVIMNCSISNGKTGIGLVGVENALVAGNVFSNVENGTVIEFSTNVEVVGNNYSDGGVAIHLINSDNVEVSGNTIASASAGMVGEALTLTKILNNNINGVDGNATAIISSRDVEVLRNSFEDSGVGLYIHDSESVTVWRNNFINNTVQAVNSSSDVAFNNTVDDFNIGNYWSDADGKDENMDGILDEPYRSDNVTDFAPLAYPAGPPVIANFTVPENITNSGDYIITAVVFDDSPYCSSTLEVVRQSSVISVSNTSAYNESRLISVLSISLSTDRNDYPGMKIILSTHDSNGNMVRKEVEKNVIDVVPPEILDYKFYKYQDTMVKVEVKASDEAEISACWVTYNATFEVDNNEVNVSGNVILQYDPSTYSYVGYIDLSSVNYNGTTKQTTLDDVKNLEVVIYVEDNNGNVATKRKEVDLSKLTSASVDPVVIAMIAVGSIGVATLAYYKREMIRGELKELKKMISKERKSD